MKVTQMKVGELKEVLEEMKSKYILQRAESSRCPVCAGELDLLCRADGRTKDNPWFYICWFCVDIYQSGKGRINRQ